MYSYCDLASEGSVGQLEVQWDHDSLSTEDVVATEPPPMLQMMQWHKYRTNDPGIAWLRKTLHQAVIAMDQEMLTS
jgi:hypothetical protein